MTVVFSILPRGKDDFPRWDQLDGQLHRNAPSPALCFTPGPQSVWGDSFEGKSLGQAEEDGAHPENKRSRDFTLLGRRYCTREYIPDLHGVPGGGGCYLLPSAESQ